jgi:hypothetical protein
VALAFALAISASACGDSGETETSRRGGLDRDLAESLAAKSDEVAELVDRGDECAAAHLADDIVAEVEDRSREIPDPVLAELEPAVGHLQGQVSCEEPVPAPLPQTETEIQPPPTTTEDEGEGEGGEDGEGSGEGEGSGGGRSEVPGRGDERGGGQQKQKGEGRGQQKQKDQGGGRGQGGQLDGGGD